MRVLSRWGLREYAIFTYLYVNCVFRWLNVAVPGKRNSFGRLICVSFNSPACAHPPDTCFELMVLLLLDIQQTQCSMYDRKQSVANFLSCRKTVKEKHSTSTSLLESILSSPTPPPSIYSSQSPVRKTLKHAFEVKAFL